MPFGWVAAGGAILGAGASIYGASQQSKAGDKAAQNTEDMFNIQQANLAPWRTTGGEANNALAAYMGLGPGGGPANPNAPGMATFKPSDLFADPSYQFRLQQGENAVGNAASAGGGSLGGNALKAYSDYAQGSASQEYGAAFDRWNTMQNNIFSRLASISGTGANVAGGIAGLGMNAVNTAGGFSTGAAASRAGGAVGATNALNAGGANYYNNRLLGQNQTDPNTTYMQQDPSGGGSFNDYTGAWE